MNEVKSLKTLALPITEKEYRQLPEISYSSIAKYDKMGFYAVSKLGEKEESEALTFGSIVDTLITEGMEVFHEKFAIANFPIPVDSVKAVIDDLLITCEESSLEDINGTVILESCLKTDFQRNFKPDTKVSKIREQGTAYYDAVKSIGDRVLISDEMYQDAISTVALLKRNASTSKYFCVENNSHVEYLYQQKFKTTLEGLPVRCMFDALIVNHDKKCIIPVDLKTTSFPEYDFARRYLENHYHLQSRLYTRILQDIISRDELFKDYKILPFTFIVVNKITKTPLIYKDEFYNLKGDIELTFKSGRKGVLKDPVELGLELQTYIDNKSIVPNNISLTGNNLLNKEVFECL